MEAMVDLQSIRQILEELAAGDDRLRDTFPLWRPEDTGCLAVWFSGNIR